MKIIAFNGSPRKDWNTATLLQQALDGAVSQGAETELIHLYDLNFKGCISCFACKVKEGKSYGRCGVKDELQPLLKKVEEVDVMLLGSPIYFGNVSGEMRSLMERLLFPYLMYSKVDPRTLFPKKLHIGLVYTMNVPEEALKQVKYDELFQANENLFKRIFRGDVASLYSTDTYQFTDYTKVVADMFDFEAKTKRRQEIFPIDCRKAYEMGVKFGKMRE
ncbi:NADPH-dependent FMN reductase [Clostridium aceticum]|uniref:NADPH-dependent FMN reductase n=1 Tax=Clostridium aceticum TaxID=84022 RepID=A0A0D8I7M7_9CLOT|nr:flavodoxin family protein [Clostridium aceticum]AKL97265.1 NADPH-dependent FMN reductase [Clostridium aceticum]KJF26290.1 flavodoxin [Clostridium aceticum]